MCREYEWGGLWHASLVRLSTLGIWFAIVLQTPYVSYADLPDSLFNGFGLGRPLLSSQGVRDILLSQWTLATLKLTALLGCVYSMIDSRGGRLIPVALFINVLILDFLTKAIGEYASHAQAAPLFVLAVFTLFAGRRYLPLQAFLPGLPWHRHTKPNEPTAHSSVVWLCAFVLVVPYAFIGTNRILAGGLGMFQGDAILAYVAISTSGSFPADLNDLPFVSELLKLGFFAATVLEISSPLALSLPRYRTVWLIAISGFHLVTVLLMNIFFWENVVLLWVLFWWGWRDMSVTQEVGRRSVPPLVASSRVEARL